MEALEALLTRRSVRAYEERMPEQDLIDKVMEALLGAFQRETGAILRS